MLDLALAGRAGGRTGPRPKALGGWFPQRAAPRARDAHDACSLHELETPGFVRSLPRLGAARDELCRQREAGEGVPVW